MRLMLVALLFVSAAPAAIADPLETPPRCADMRRLSDAANRTGSFQALFDEGFAPPLLYGCQTRAGGYHCWRNVTPDEVNPAGYGAIIRDCLPGATMTTEARQPRRNNIHIVRHGRLTARLSDSCSSQCKAGRGMSIAFTIDPDRAPLDQGAD